MAKAKKLKSGSWRCLVYSHTEKVIQPDGTAKEKRIYKSFTYDEPGPKGKRKCEQMAAEWAVDKKENEPSVLTFGMALDNYIDSRRNVLSPGTICDYNNARKNHMQGLMDVDKNNITQAMIQKEINIESLNHSPKMVRNIHGLISAVLGVYRPDFALNTTLPKRKRVERT